MWAWNTRPQNPFDVFPADKNAVLQQHEPLPIGHNSSWLTNFSVSSTTQTQRR